MTLINPPAPGLRIISTGKGPKPKGHIFGTVSAVDGNIVEFIRDDTGTTAFVEWKGIDGINPWIEFSG